MSSLFYLISLIMAAGEYHTFSLFLLFYYHGGVLGSSG